MAAAEGVADVRHGELDFGHFASLKGLWFLEAVPEFAAKDITAHELLIAAELRVRRVRLGI